jgi:hypothetical protein
MKISALIACLLILTGCTTVSVEYTHLSHPNAGWPVSPEWTEDTLDGVAVVGRREYGERLYVESALVYKLRDGGIRGPDLAYIGRIGVTIYDRRER